LFIKLPSKSYTDLYVQPQHVAAVFVDEQSGTGCSLALTSEHTGLLDVSISADQVVSLLADTPEKKHQKILTVLGQALGHIDPAKLAEIATMIIKAL